MNGLSKEKSMTVREAAEALGVSVEVITKKILFKTNFVRSYEVENVSLAAYDNRRRLKEPSRSQVRKLANVLALV